MNRILPTFGVVLWGYPVPSGVVLVKSAAAFVVLINSLTVDVVDIFVQERCKKALYQIGNFGAKMVYGFLVCLWLVLRNDRLEHFPLTFQ